MKVVKLPGWRNWQTRGRRALCVAALHGRRALCATQEI